jgi:hypothetical protein
MRLPQRSWYFWPVAFLALEVAWFALLHPLVPSTLSGFLFEAVVPLPLALYAWLSVNWIHSLLRMKPTSMLRQALAVVVAVSLGVAIFVGAYLAREFLSSQFHYFIFRR